VNGGNCRAEGVNWIHYVHAAWAPHPSGGPVRRARQGYVHRRYRADEAAALARARLVLTNSDRSRRDVVERVGIPAERVRTVYYGIDPLVFKPASSEDVARSRAELGWPAGRPVVAFVGALGDRRKGFDTLFAAWRSLCRQPSWDADLVVVGSGADLEAWKARALSDGLAERIRFLGFRKDVGRILSASDALVAPTRYEAFGLGVLEALACGLPALVTRDAGVAERYDPSLAGLLIDDPDDATDLAARLGAWRARADEVRASVASLSERLRARTWDVMSEEIARLTEEAGVAGAAP
jgi:glycosyltransferase involved in cell wall biosynthesis